MGYVVMFVVLFVLLALLLFVTWRASAKVALLEQGEQESERRAEAEKTFSQVMQNLDRLDHSDGVDYMLDILQKRHDKR